MSHSPRRSTRRRSSCTQSSEQRCDGVPLQAARADGGSRGRTWTTSLWPVHPGRVSRSETLNEREASVLPSDWGPVWSASIRFGQRADFPPSFPGSGSPPRSMLASCALSSDLQRSEVELERSRVVVSRAGLVPAPCLAPDLGVVASPQPLERKGELNDVAGSEREPAR